MLKFDFIIFDYWNIQRKQLNSSWKSEMKLLQKCTEKKKKNKLAFNYIF